MKNNNLILVGGGGHCKSVIDVAESAGFNIIGILDLPENVGKKVLNYNILGSDKDISNFINDTLFIVTVGQIKDVSLRIMLHNKISNVGGKFATIIAPTAHVSKYALIGEGTVIMHHSLVNANAKIGRGCIINSFSNIEHDSIIGDYCHISTGAMINGDCKVGGETFIGSQTVVLNGITLAPGCVISAGSVVRKDIVKKGIYSGNPASIKIKL